MKIKKFFIKPKPEEKKKLDEALSMLGWLPGPPSEKISFEEAKATLKKYEEEVESHEQAGRNQEAARCRHQAAAWCLILAPRALFKGDRKLLKECLEKYEILTGKKILEEDELDRAINLATNR